MSATNRQSRTYPTVADALADPESAIAQFVARGMVVRAENEKAIRSWMETGLTREEAWAAALRAGRRA